MTQATLLEKLGLSELETKVFLAMLDGQVKVKEIQDVTGVKRPSVYYAISSLEKRGLVGRIQVGEYNTWKVSSLNRLRSIVNDSREEIEELEKEVEQFIASTPIASEQTETKVTYYKGQEAIEHIVFNSLYCKDKKIKSIAPDSNFFFEAGQDFAMKYVQERNKRDIETYHLWENIFDPKVVRDLYKESAHIRLLPPSMKGKFKTTVFIYDDKVMYIAPKKSNYAVVFESAEHVALMDALFEAAWTASKKYKSK